MGEKNMPLMKSEYRDRLVLWKKALVKDFYHPLARLTFEGFETEADLTPEEAQRGDFRALPPGYRWGRSWSYMWVRAKAVMPEEAAGERIVMDLNLSGEATLFVNGKAFGTRRADWIQQQHHFMIDNVLTLCAKPGESFDLLFEVYAGHDYPAGGEFALGPVFPGEDEPPRRTGGRAVMGESSFGIWNEDAYQLWLDVTGLSMIMEQLPEDSLRASEIADGLEAFTRTVDFEQERPGRIADYRRAREMLKPLMAAKNGSTAPHIGAIGNSHLDLAWLWPLRETWKKTARTFAQQLRLLEQYPDYRYLQSQPAAYEMCREHFPELFERIRQAIREGRWIADGAMYVEPDTNMPSGEALVRQLSFGLRYYRDVLGVESRVLWLPDTFGYSAALPQILKKCHVDRLVTQKIFWSYNEGAPFPYHYFTWEGMDGSRVVSFLPTSYTYSMTPQEMSETWKGRIQKRGLNGFLMPFGYGDGGGGPSREHIEWAEREADWEGLPKVSIESPRAFFDRMEENGAPRDTWTGEMYFTAHRGTYTSQAKIKKNNRKSEFALRDMELWGTIAQLHQTAVYPYERAEKLWKTLLLNQFHDILPGSSIQRVNEEANAAHEDLQRQAADMTAGFQKSLMQADEGFTVFNALGFARTEVVRLPEALCGGAVTAEGKPVPVENGYGLVTAPAMGWTALCPAERSGAEEHASAALTEDGALLKNDRVQIRLNHLGEITSYRDTQGREYADAPMNVLHLYKDVPRKFDAWDIDSNYRQQEIALPAQAAMTVLEAQGLTAAVCVKRQIGHSEIRQIIRLNIRERTVRFETEVDWHELHRLLKVEFPVRILAETARHEIQYGFVERPTHRNREEDQDRFEVCNHRYTALCDSGHGCAVYNDCKYGVSVERNRIALTLMRAPGAPEMRADQGKRGMTYAFGTWEAPWGEAPAVREGLRLNVPLTLCPGSAKPFGLFECDRDNVILDTVKPADDQSGDVILRLYESLKQETTFTLHSGVAAGQVWLCDMLETPEKELPGGQAWTLEIRPFEVMTLRLHIGPKQEGKKA